MTKHLGVLRFMVRPSLDSKIGRDSDRRRNLTILPNLCFGYQYKDSGADYGLIGIGYLFQFLKGITTSSCKSHMDGLCLILGLMADFNIAKISMFLDFGLHIPVECIVDKKYNCKIMSPIVVFYGCSNLI